MKYRYETSNGQTGELDTASGLITLLESLSPQECILIDRVSDSGDRSSLSDSLRSRQEISAFWKAQLLNE